MKAIVAASVPILRAQNCLNGISRFDQSTSCGSGAIFVTHNIGFEDRRTCLAAAAA